MSVVPSSWRAKRPRCVGLCCLARTGVRGIHRRKRAAETAVARGDELCGSCTERYERWFASEIEVGE